jgi:hypothetical protein
LQDDVGKLTNELVSSVENMQATLKSQLALAAKESRLNEDALL